MIKMLDCEITKQMEKRGRFLIQEIEEDISYSLHANKITQSEKLKTNLLTVNSSKRTKHSSIIMDSKIFHTTRIDSNFSNGLFTCLIYEDNNKDWVDFDQIWKQFSKIHGDLCEDDMEKIFQYIDKRIDDSDFFSVNSYSNLQSCNVEKNLKLEEKIKISIENENKINENFITNMTSMTNKDVIKKTEETCQSQSRFNYNHLCENENILNKNFNKEKSKFKTVINKSHFLTNFCDHPFISPAVSPINSNGKFLNFSKNFFDKNKNEMKKKNYQGEINRHSDKIKKKCKIFMERNLDVKKNFIMEICENVSFAIFPCIKKENNLVINREIKFQLFKEMKIESNSFEKISNLDEDKRCSICKNKI